MVFLDTSFAIALVIERDEYHTKALDIARQLRTNRIRIVTTRAVALEIGNALSRLRYRQNSITLLTSLERDKDVEIVAVTEDLYARAFKLYRERPDKEWSLTDCVSFVVMQEQDLIDALTTDGHFKQAGFNAVLLSGAIEDST